MMSGGDQSSMVSILQEMEEKHEYETQFFGFTPKSFVDGVYNAIFEYLNDGIELLEKYLVSEFEKDGVSQEVVREGTEKLLVHFRNRFDKACDKLEKYLMKNIFHIPGKTLLPCDAVHRDNHHTEREEQALDEEIQQLQIMIKNLKFVNAFLKQYMVDMEKVHGRLEALLTKIDGMEKVCRQTGVSDLKECIIFIAGKVGRIQSKLKDITSVQLELTQSLPDDIDLGKQD